MNLDFASSESPQEPPRSSKRSLWSSRTRQEAIRQPTWSLCQAPREPKVMPTNLQRRSHQGARGGMRGAVRIIKIIIINVIIIIDRPLVECVRSFREVYLSPTPLLPAPPRPPRQNHRKTRAIEQIERFIRTPTGFPRILGNHPAGCRGGKNANRSTENASKM